MALPAAKTDNVALSFSRWLRSILTRRQAALHQDCLSSRTFCGRPAVSHLTLIGLSERFWLNLQTRYDLEVEKDKLADRLEREVLAALEHA
jgi:hypothetical protein